MDPGLTRMCVCVCQIVVKLKEEIGAMEKEHSDLQMHISRTDWWCENLGSWRAVITGAEVTHAHTQTHTPAHTHVHKHAHV